MTDGPGRAERPAFAAIMTVFNEADIVEQSIRRLVGQGIGVYVVDNWSGDDTARLVRQFDGRGLLGYEKFPPGAPSATFSLGRLLGRVEQLHRSIGARWTIHHDADEFRESPWPGVSYREGLERIEREGFNCATHVVVNFRPVADDFAPGQDPEAHFRFFEMPELPGHFIQAKAWRTEAPVHLRDNAGHDAHFAGRRVYPTPFILKHYPIRGSAHGRRKVLAERLARFDPGERARGWHVHYDRFARAPEFIWDPRTLCEWSEAARGRVIARACAFRARRAPG